MRSIVAPRSAHQNWNLTFYISAVIYMLGVVCWLFLDSVTPLEQEE